MNRFEEASPRQMCKAAGIIAVCLVMSDPVTNELLLEIMKNVKADVASLCLDVGELKGGMATLSARLTSIDQRLAVVHTDLALLSERMDHLEARMDGIEGRLE
jgi:hypothetical protein